MQKCYNCGKEVDDNVLICPDCGALVKRYGKPEPAREERETEPFPQDTAFDTRPQPRGAIFQREDGKLKFSGYVTFWLVLCAIYLGYTLLGFACTLFIYRFRDFYFEILDQFEELASMAELYVSDAFGTVHRAHASTAGVAAYLPAVSGLLVAKELEVMGKALDDPKRPFVAVLGGALRPVKRLGEILFHAEPAVVEVPDLAFGEGIALFGKFQMTGEALVVLLRVPVFFDQLVAPVQLWAGLVIT